LSVARRRCRRRSRTPKRQMAVDCSDNLNKETTLAPPSRLRKRRRQQLRRKTIKRENNSRRRLHIKDNKVSKDIKHFQ
jgi:hypothetical protein